MQSRWSLCLGRWCGPAAQWSWQVRATAAFESVLLRSCSLLLVGFRSGVDIHRRPLAEFLPWVRVAYFGGQLVQQVRVFFRRLSVRVSVTGTEDGLCREWEGSGAGAAVCCRGDCERGSGSLSLSTGRPMNIPPPFHCIVLHFHYIISSSISSYTSFPVIIVLVVAVICATLSVCAHDTG